MDSTHERGNADGHSNHVHIRQTPRFIDQRLESLSRGKVGFRVNFLLSLELVVSLRLT